MAQSMNTSRGLLFDDDQNELKNESSSLNESNSQTPTTNNRRATTPFTNQNRRAITTPLTNTATTTTTTSSTTANTSAPKSGPSEDTIRRQAKKGLEDVFGLQYREKLSKENLLIFATRCKIIDSTTISLLTTTTDEAALAHWCRQIDTLLTEIGLGALTLLPKNEDDRSLKQYQDHNYKIRNRIFGDPLSDYTSHVPTITYKNTYSAIKGALQIGDSIVTPRDPPVCEEDYNKYLLQLECLYLATLDIFYELEEKIYNKIVASLDRAAYGHLIPWKYEEGALRRIYVTIRREYRRNDYHYLVVDKTAFQHPTRFKQGNPKDDPRRTIDNIEKEAYIINETHKTGPNHEWIMALDKIVAIRRALSHLDDYDRVIREVDSSSRSLPPDDYLEKLKAGISAEYRRLQSAEKLESSYVPNTIGASAEVPSFPPLTPDAYEENVVNAHYVRVPVGYCFQQAKEGKCNVKDCPYKHNDVDGIGSLKHNVPLTTRSTNHEKRSERNARSGRFLTSKQKYDRPRGHKRADAHAATLADLEALLSSSGDSEGEASSDEDDLRELKSISPADMLMAFKAGVKFGKSRRKNPGRGKSTHPNTLSFIEKMEELKMKEKRAAKEKEQEKEKEKEKSKRNQAHAHSAAVGAFLDRRFHLANDELSSSE
jgi:hypothetical protein